MGYYKSMQELIGNTPLVEITHIKLPIGVRLFAKLELYNPAGSVKDRIGKYMIGDAEQKGLLKKAVRSWKRPQATRVWALRLPH